MTTQDTPQQKAILRRNERARKVRRMFPVGARVAAATPPDMRGNRTIQSTARGTIVRHVPGINSQGGYIVVEWDNGRTGRHGPISIMVVGEE